MILATSHYISILWLKRELLIGAPVFDSRSICLIVIGLWLSWMWLTKSSNLVGKLLLDPIFVSMTLAVPSTSTHRDQGPLNTTGCVKVRAKNLIYRCCRFARDCAAWSRCIHMHCHHRGVIPLKYLLRVQQINLPRRQMNLLKTLCSNQPQTGDIFLRVSCFWKSVLWMQNLLHGSCRMIHSAFSGTTRMIQIALNSAPTTPV